MKNRSLNHHAISKVLRWPAAFLVLLSFLPLVSGFEQMKLDLERALEDRVQSALSKLVDPDQFMIIVKLEPFTVEELKSKNKASTGGSTFVLPGIPERKTLEKLGPEKAAIDLVWQSKPFIKQLSVTLFLDKALSNNQVQEIEVLVKQLVDFNVDRNDQLKIQRISPRRSDRLDVSQAQNPMQYLKISVDQLKDRKDFYWIVLGTVLSMVVIIFLFGPVLFFLRKFPKVLQQAMPGETAAAPEANRAAPAAAGGALGTILGKFDLGGGSAPIVLNMDGKSQPGTEIFLGEPEKPFNFLNEKDIINVLLLMKEEPPLHLAIIAYHLRPDLAAAMISGLDNQIRKQILEHLAAPQILMRDEVKSLGQSLKQKVRGIIYGVDQYFAIYDSASPNAQPELLKALEMQTPALVEKMRSEMFSFEDLMALDPNALRVVFREVPLRSLATSLMGSAVALRDRVLGVLPGGAAEIIRQEIEMNTNQSQKNIDEERKKIVHVVRRLVWDKKIVMPPRQRGSRAAAQTANVGE